MELGLKESPQKLSPVAVLVKLPTSSGSSETGGFGGFSCSTPEIRGIFFFY